MTDEIADRLDDILDDLGDAAGCGCCGSSRLWSEAVIRIRELVEELAMVDTIASPRVENEEQREALERIVSLAKREGAWGKGYDGEPSLAWRLAQIAAEAISPDEDES